MVDTIEDIGKESDGWEEDEARTEGQDMVLTYPASSFDRDRMITAIKSVGKRQLMREARIAMRTIDALWVGDKIGDEDLKRMADAAERLAIKRRKNDNEQKQAVASLSAMCKDMGLKALAMLLGVDAANLAKVIGGKRPASRFLTIKIRRSGTTLAE